jgi:hypothetical protein
MSASSSAIRERLAGSEAIALDSSGVAQRKCSISSPVSAASAMLRFFGE